MIQLTALSGLAGLHAGCSAAIPPQPLFDLQLVDRENGAVLTRYPSRGRYFSPGTPGGRYAVRLVNRSAERVLMVLSVDGVNAITGDTAAWTQSGYVLGPGEAFDITGWRKSDSHIAAFEFTSLGDSYASRTGRPANVGVVGAAVFREVPPPPVVRQAPPVSVAPAPMPPPAALASSLSAAADVARPAATQERAARTEPEVRAAAKLGTGHGASEWSPIQHTAFQRRTRQPERVLEVHYDSQANLAAAGIMPPAVAALPTAFPSAGGGYVPDPPRRW
ncbi:MAG: hypothetical protein EOP39_16590 [Rubrivivax sp.]|nr:MAG: hypothetical protein EOP39_16590 [Rubrivivax sp.]